MTGWMRLTFLAPALLLGGCIDDTDMSSAAPSLVSRGEMPAFCRGAAAEQFSVRPTEVTTLPAEPDQGLFTVPGEADGIFFSCTFTADGRLVGVDRV